MKIKSLPNVFKLGALHMLLVLSLGCTSLSNGPADSSLPSSVDRVETFRVNEQLVRVIVHNMELQPKLGLELMATPSGKLLDSTTLTQTKINGELLDFAQSSGVFVESVEAADSGVKVTFDYFYLRGGSAIITCYLAVQTGYFGEPDCRME